MEVCPWFELIAIENATALGDDLLEIGKAVEAQMTRHMRHGSPPRLMAHQPIDGRALRESHTTPSAGNRITLRGHARQVFKKADNIGQSLGRNGSVALVHDSGLSEKGPIEECGAVSSALAIHAGFNQQSSDAGDPSGVDRGNNAGDVLVLGSPQPDRPV